MISISAEQEAALAHLRERDRALEKTALTANDMDPVTVPPAPPFRIDILPDRIADYVRAQAAAIGVPVEMIALPLLANIGALMGNRIAIQLKAGFRQYAALWVGMIAPPGAAKTPALNAGRAPLDVLQGEWYDTYRTQRAEYEADLERWSAAPKGERGTKPTPPSMRHAYSTDATIEAIAAMLQTTYGLSLQHDELVSFIRAMDQYRSGKGADKQKFLSFWAGTPAKVDRRTGEPIYIRHPVVSVVGGIQPDLIADLRDRNGKEDGFIDRFLLIRPDVMRRGWSEDEADPALLDAVVTDLRTIDKNLMPEPDAKPDQFETVRLHSEARHLWIDWYNTNERRVAGAMGLHAGILAKLPLQVARIALILNTIWNIEDPGRMVSASIMEAAIWLGEFCLTHWERALPLIGQSVPAVGENLPTRIIAILRDEATAENDGWVSRSVVYRRLRNVSPEDLTTALDALYADGLADTQTIETNRKPREEWRATDKCESHLSHLSVAGGINANNAIRIYSQHSEIDVNGVGYEPEIRDGVGVW
ncbi:MAG: DUF3987 domain-containing protein [Thermomicrobiales bacterium]